MGPKDANQASQPADAGAEGSLWGVAETEREPGILAWPMSWQGPFWVGVITVILGIVVSALPSQSLMVIAILLGILMIVSGLYHLIAVFTGGEHRRLWHGIAALLFIVTGVVLIRHLDLSVAVIGLVVGITWIVQGVSLLLAGASRGPRGGGGWPLVFGAVSVIAGIVVVASPVASVTVLAVLTGIWFIIMGLMETFGALALRRAIRQEKAETVMSVPGQRTAEADSGATRRQDVTG
jgi:uncharacterized membrane protein HdeD (DUF308 family)